MALLLSKFFRNMENIFELEDRQEVPFGVLQSALQPYFPDWRRNLTLPGQIFREGTHIFKVSMGRVKFRIAIPAKLTLDSLASAILNAVRFDHDHLYEFSYRNRFGAGDRLYHPYMEEGPWATERLVGKLPLEVEQTMTFLFDFGDKWEFQVSLEQIDPNMVLELASLLEIHGEPPEQYPMWNGDE